MATFIEIGDVWIRTDAIAVVRPYFGGPVEKTEIVLECGQVVIVTKPHTEVKRLLNTAAAEA